MSCVLRVFGKHLDIDALLSDLSLPPLTVWKLGQEGRGLLRSNSGATFPVSDAEFEEFSLQLTDAGSYLKLNAEQLRKIASFKGVDKAVLDFAVSTRKGFYTQTSSFPAIFLQQAGLLGLGLDVSHYPTGEDDD